MTKTISRCVFYIQSGKFIKFHAIFSSFQPTTFKSNLLRIEMDCHNTWCEIDAIKLVGRESHLRKTSIY